eukprot:1578385-Pyramimonas_sp.AAC.1
MQRSPLTDTHYYPHHCHHFRPFCFYLKNTSSPATTTDAAVEPLTRTPPPAPTIPPSLYCGRAQLSPTAWTPRPPTPYIYGAAARGGRRGG